MTAQKEFTAVFCDWLTAVGDLTILNTLIKVALTGVEVKDGKPGYHHSRSWEYSPYGLQLFFSPLRPEVDAVLVVDGQANAVIRDTHGVDFSWGFIQHMAYASHHFSRIDFTMDYYDTGLLALTASAKALNGELSFGRRSASVMRDVGDATGATLYVGKRTSPMMLRLYNKAAESKGKTPATRIEFELKDGASKAVHAEFKDEFASSLPSRIMIGLLKNFLVPEEWPEFEDLFYGDIHILRPEARESMLTKKEWLKRQVIPTFVRSWDNGGEELWAWFREVVEEVTRQR